MLDTIFEVPRKRPKVVTIIAVLVCIQGIFRALIAILFLLEALLGAYALPTSSVVAGAIAGVLAGIVGLVTLYFAWGLWTLKRWAYWATVILMVLDLLGSVLEFTQPITATWSIWAGVIIPVVVLIYFLAVPGVRKAFQP
jgi:hypothetical protein